MKYTTNQYAKALQDALDEALAKDKKALIRRFLDVVRKNCDSPRLGLILRAFEKEYLRRNNLHAVRLEIPSSAVAAAVRREIKSILGKGILLSEEEKPELLAGIKITIDEEVLIDASGKRQLERMFSDF